MWPTVNIDLANKNAARWYTMGYKVAVLVDGDEAPAVPNADAVFAGGIWQGFPTAVNWLMRMLDADISIIAGDDVFPETRVGAAEIAQEFRDHFGPSLCGVMQPTGDRYGSIDTCAVSPWIGKGFRYRMHGEVYCEAYFHYFSDQELCSVASTGGLYWPRADLMQYHDHWGRDKAAKPPAHLYKAQGLWKNDREIFRHRNPEAAREQHI